MTREEAIYRLRNMACLYKSVEEVKQNIEAIGMAIEALQAQPTHGRLIDADALMEYCSNQKTKTISNNDIARFPTVQADRPQGEWIRTSNDWIDGTCGARYYPIHCSICNYSTYDDSATNFCPNCGTRMYKGGDDK